MSNPTYRLSTSEGDGKPYIVADSDAHGQGSGRVLVARVLRHKPGSADRVCPDEIQDQHVSNLLRNAVTVPQAFLDLLTLAKGLDAFRDDYRMNAVLRVCDELIGAKEKEADEYQDLIDALMYANGGPDGEHHYWDRAEWQREAGCGDTQRGYWDWVAAKVEEDGDGPEAEESTCAEVKAAYAAEGESNG